MGKRLKTCKRCLLEKNTKEFYKDKSRKDNLRDSCTSCDKKYREDKFKEKSEYDNLYYKKNMEKIKQYKKEYYIKNSDNIIVKKTQYQRTRLKIDSLYRFTTNVRNLIKDSFKRNKTGKYKKQSKTVTLLGCTIPELRDHLEKQFQPGMTFENHGQHGWHIDHIIPLSSANTQEDVEKLCHYTNLQPLWAADNRAKGKKY